MDEKYTFTTLDNAAETISAPSGAPTYSMGQLDPETIQILEEDRIATGG